MKKLLHVLFVAICLSVLSQEAVATTYYCSPTGTSDGAGTQESPYDLNTALGKLAAGDVLNLMDGQYDFDTRVRINKSGTEGNMITIQAVNPRQAVLDFRFEPYTPDGYGYVGLYITANYVHVKGLVVRYAGKCGVLLSGGNCILENIESYGNCNTGIQLKSCTATNLVLNCDSHDNFDYEESNDGNVGGNADGFADKQYEGPGNIYRGCRAWNNSDDGWDSFQRVTEGYSPTIYENCVCYNNCPATYNMSIHPRYLCGIDAEWFNTCGKDLSAYTHSGNGNGFKLGGAGTLHNLIVRRCLAVANKIKGFDQNNNSGTMEIYNCTSYYNGYNYGFGVGGAYAQSPSLTVKNCISYNYRTGSDFFTGTSSLTSDHNSWNTAGISVSVDDFQSLDYNEYILAPRNADGSLAETPLLRLNNTSEMINAGVEVEGIDYNGSAPDMGCFEATKKYNVSVTAGTGGTAEASPSGSVDEGTEVTFTATPNSGYKFLRWSNNETDNPYVVNVTGDIELNAVFEVKPVYKEITETTIFTEFTSTGLTDDWIVPNNIDYSKCSTGTVTNYIDPATDAKATSPTVKYAQIKSNRYISFRVTNAVKATLYGFHTNATAERGMTISDGTTTNTVTVKPGSAYSVSIDLDGTDKTITIATNEGNGVNAYAVKFDPVPTSVALSDDEDYTATEDKTYADGVTYTRNFDTNLANKWSSLYVPFAVNVEDYAEEFDIAEIFAMCPVKDTNHDGEVTAEDEEYLILSKKTSGTTLPNKPYLIRVKSAGEQSIEAADGKLYAAANGTVSCSTAAKNYVFTGTYTTVVADTENDYWYMSGGAISHRTSGSTNVNSYRWYMATHERDEYSSDVNAVNSINIMVIGEEIDNATAINAVSQSKDSTNEKIYNIGGMQLGNNHSGIIISNGIKIITK